MAVASLDEWHAGGQRVPVVTRIGEEHHVFAHVDGQGPTVTLLHGFPTSSWDFAPLVERLQGVQTLAVDLLGFGNADKPLDHGYALGEQLDLVRQVWTWLGVDETWIVAHDYSASLVQQALARRLAGTWAGPTLQAVTLLNGGLFYSAIDRKLVQDVLRWPIVGSLFARLLPRSVFERELASVFADEHRPTREALEQHWQAATMREGRRVIPRVAGYLDERKTQEERFTRALAETDVPVRYVWGLEDPVSGGSILDALRERVQAPDVVELEGTGHYPHLEAPERVAEHGRVP